MPSPLVSRRPSVVLAAALLAGAAWLPTGASADTTPAPAPTATLDDAVLTAGETTVVRGTAAPSTTVDLFQASRPSTTFALFRSTTTELDGTFSFVVGPGTNSRYYVAVDDPAGTKQTSTAVLLGVRRAVRLDPVVVDGDRVTASGRLLPRGAAPVSIVFTRDDVRTEEARTSADPRAGFRTSFLSDRRGAFLVSAAVPATADNLAGESAAQQVVVRPAAAGSAQG